METNLKDYQKEWENEDKEREKRKNTPRSFSNFTVDPNQYLGCGKNQDVVFRILGEPFENRKKGTDHRLVLTSRLAKDTMDGYVKVFWPVEKRDLKYVPDPSFILTRLYDKVMESKWVNWTEEDMKTNSSLKKNEKGVIVNEKGHNGYYVRLHKDTKVFGRINNNQKVGEKYPKNFYPSQRVLVNVIDRTDNWCSEKNQTKLICADKREWQSSEGEDRFSVEVGLPITIYRKIVDLHARFSGDWEKIDTVLQKKYNADGTFDAYEVYDASEERRFLDPKTIEIASSEELTDQEKEYEQIDFDKRYRVSYRLLMENLSALFKQCDAELNTSFYDELSSLVEKEREEYEESKEAEADSTPPEEEVPTKDSKGKISDEEMKKVFPKYSELAIEDVIALNESVELISNGLPQWKAGVNVATCWDDKNCMFPNSDVKTSFPQTVAQCPVCGRKS